jgi:predicted cupin superfamily sugar epimerase
MSNLIGLAAFLSAPLALQWCRVNKKQSTASGQETAAAVDPLRIASSLGVVPHPEGGYFVETYRSGSEPMASKGLTALDGALLETERDGSSRNVMTSIIFMATKDARILYFGLNKSDHVHYYHGGNSYTYIVVHPDGRVEEIVLGGDVQNGEKLQIVFIAGCYKAGFLNGDYCLIGEGVAPGFDFRDFQFVDENELRKVIGMNGDSDLLKKYLPFIKPDRRRNFNDYYETN